MKIDIKALNVLLARRCMSLSDLRSGVSPQTLTRIRRGEDITPKTLGRIAKAFNVDVSAIMKEEA